MAGTAFSEVLDGLWRAELPHPEWTEEEGGEDGWEPRVAWWALTTPRGLVLIDPLVEEWGGVDALVRRHGGCAGVIRLLHWHQRSVAEAAARYGAAIWAKPPPPEEGPWRAYDHPLGGEAEALGTLRAYDVERVDELALWLPDQAALLFGDAMLRRPDGRLRVCPDGWLQPTGGPARLRAVLAELAELPAQHVLVSHGPLVLGDGAAAMRAALA